MDYMQRLWIKQKVLVNLKMKNLLFFTLQTQNLGIIKFL